jgi:hypothetical protein
LWLQWLFDFDEAAFFQSGKCPKKAPHPKAWRMSGFNGAAFFQSGKFFYINMYANMYALSRGASMEPLFFKAENTEARRALDLEPLLQWSRFFSKRKMEVWPDFRRLREIASMEPLFFKAENGKTGRSLPSRGWLQWSRFFSKRKMRRVLPKRRPAASFNGAAFFQSGKCLARLSQKERREASMEPLFFKAENASW